MDCKTVVGIYGVSGSGKSTLLSLLGSSHPEWHCLEGSQVISTVMEEEGETMNDFYEKNDDERSEIRNRAVKMIQTFHGVTIVAGHCSFPATSSTDCDEPFAFKDVFTEGDGETFDVILYLDTDPAEVHSHRKQDNETSKRSRTNLSVEAIRTWIEHEKKVLQQECDKHGIHLALVTNQEMVEGHIATRVLAPLVTKVQAESARALKAEVGKVPASEVFLLIDGDRTLCPIDTGKAFADQVLPGSDDPLKKIFKRYAEYSFQAFLEVAMYYANIMSTPDYQALSLSIGQHDVVIYNEWIHFLTTLPPNVHAVVLTSGNREIWQVALESNKLSSVTLLAGNHIGLHSYLVDSQAKADVVNELRELYGGCKIFSFGDSGKSGL